MVFHIPPPILSVAIIQIQRYIHEMFIEMLVFFEEFVLPDDNSDTSNTLTLF